MALERDTPEHRSFRKQFCAYITALNTKRLVFIDESYCKTGMCREHGWSQRGFRAKGKRPFRSWKTVSLIGAIRQAARRLRASLPLTKIVGWFRKALREAQLK